MLIKPGININYLCFSKTERFINPTTPCVNRKNGRISMSRISNEGSFVFHWGINCIITRIEIIIKKIIIILFNIIL